VIFGRAAGDEEPGGALKILRPRLLAKSTLATQSEIPSLRSGQALRCAQDDSEGLGVTVQRRFPHPLLRPEGGVLNHLSLPFFFFRFLGGGAGVGGVVVPVGGVLVGVPASDCRIAAPFGLPQPLQASHPRPAE